MKKKTQKRNHNDLQWPGPLGLGPAGNLASSSSTVSLAFSTIAGYTIDSYPPSPQSTSRSSASAGAGLAASARDAATAMITTTTTNTARTRLLHEPIRKFREIQRPRQRELNTKLKSEKKLKSEIFSETLWSFGWCSALYIVREAVWFVSILIACWLEQLTHVFSRKLSKWVGGEIVWSHGFEKSKLVGRKHWPSADLWADLSPVGSQDIGPEKRMLNPCFSLKKIPCDCVITWTFINVFFMQEIM